MRGHTDHVSIDWVRERPSNPSDLLTWSHIGTSAAPVSPNFHCVWVLFWFMIGLLKTDWFESTEVQVTIKTGRTS